MTFLGDEGRDALVVYNILHGDLTLLGPRSSAADFYYGPIYYYMIAPFLWIFQYNPVGPAVFIALLGVATVFLIYKIGKEFFGTYAAITAALLYSISPLIVSYSRSSWNPNPLPFVSLLSIYLLYKAISRPAPLLFLIVGFLLGIGLQLQYISLYLVLIVGIYVFLSYLYIYRRINFTKLIQSYGRILIGFIVGFTPFLAFEILHGFPNSKTIFRFILYGNPGEIVGGQMPFGEKVGDAFFRLFGRLVVNFPAPDLVKEASLDVRLFHAAVVILGLASVGLILFQCFKAFRQSKEKFLQYALIALWMCLGIVLFGFYRKLIFDYYFGFMFPVSFLLVGNLLQFFWRQKYLKFISLAVFVALLYINLQGIPFLSEPNRQKDQVKSIADFVLSQTNGKPFNFALLTLGNSDHGYRYFFRLVDRDPVIIQNNEIDPKRSTVTDQLLIVCEDTNCQPEGAQVWEVAGFGRAKIIGEWDVSVVKVYKLEHYKGK